MEAILTIYIMYNSVLLKQSHITANVVPFQTMEQCLIARDDLSRTIKRKPPEFDKLVIKCTSLK